MNDPYVSMAQALELLPQQAAQPANQVAKRRSHVIHGPGLPAEVRKRLADNGRATKGTRSFSNPIEVR